MTWLPAREQLAQVERGVAEIYTAADLEERFASAAREDRPLRIKLGLDPSAPDVHLGHAVVLRKVRQFQDLGHQAVIIVGDFTALIGDPSGRSRTRPVLTTDDVDRHAATYLEQVGAILDTSPAKLEVKRNRDWLGALTFQQVLELAATTTVARLMERDTFEKRWKKNEPIGFHEFFYPLMQGYDSIAINSDVELGGTDQTYNNLFGRDLQKGVGQPAQIVMTMPILRGLDGVQKMSKSLDNTIGVTESANDMVQKIYSMPDDIVLHYAELLTDFDMRAVADEMEGGDVRSVKRRLAAEVARAFHDQKAVDGALANLDADTPVEMATVQVSSTDLDDEGRIWVVKLLALAGFPGSNRDLRARIEQGALRIDSETIKNVQHRVRPVAGMTMTFGNPRKKTVWRRVVMG